MCQRGTWKRTWFKKSCNKKHPSEPTCNLFKSPSNCWNPSNKATKFAGALEFVTVRDWTTRFLSTNVFKRSENYNPLFSVFSFLVKRMQAGEANLSFFLEIENVDFLYLTLLYVTNSPGQSRTRFVCQSSRRSSTAYQSEEEHLLVRAQGALCVRDIVADICS